MLDSVIINALVRNYAKDQAETFRGLLKSNIDFAQQWRAQRKQQGLPITEEDEKKLRNHIEIVQHPAHVIEWAKLPEKW